MKRHLHHAGSTHHGTHPRRRGRRLAWLFGILGAMVLYWFVFLGGPSTLYAPGFTPTLGPQARPGDVMSIDSVKTYNAAETTALIRENYGNAAPPATTSITKVTFRYRSELPGGQFIGVYGRAYIPAKPLGKLPIFGFAPGTTGIGDKCAPSLENVKVANWANYDSHMAAYASQGYAAVITDYEGMRDPTRIHHYMVGELEGRAVLDSVRALERLPEAAGVADQDQIFLGGYSQGGHAAFWADKVAAAYAPELKIRGVVGFGPVLDVQETMTDVAHGANINWFGPYVLYSYADYYKHDYHDATILQQHWADTLGSDVPAHCIDTDIPFWGKDPAAVYTPEFLQAVLEGKVSDNYPQLATDLAENAVGAADTTSAKRINQGAEDNVVLPEQAQAALPAMCRSSRGPVELQIYPKASHYTTMVDSFSATVAWMKQLAKGGKPPSTCPES